ncbi:hypothetical protein [Methylovulum psychrotolerans]|uniref:Uncharacterized protein n=1 Tax=Methylovulum psychrotolerans TaxID=1704499 RepID=A0A1Z4C470_9GAMM|nr:hypothetical protein [Methylovulum psychrotolerans]ASF48298.1 hypothetical protein CEK71_20755 [Methylovulum psychrotolerans]
MMAFDEEGFLLGEPLELGLLPGLSARVKQGLQMRQGAVATVGNPLSATLTPTGLRVADASPLYNGLALTTLLGLPDTVTAQGVAKHRMAAAQVQTQAPAAGGAQTLLTLLEHGESGKDGYRSFNRGTIKVAGGKKPKYKILAKPKNDPRDVTTLTLREILAYQALPISNNQRIFAVGKYQMIPQTLAAGIAKLNLNLDSVFDGPLQDRLFTGYLAASKRPDIEDYIKGDSKDAHAALLASAKEWRSIANPDTGRAYGSKAGDANKASIPSATWLAALDTAAQLYQHYRTQGLDEQQAYHLALMARSAEPRDADAGEAEGSDSAAAKPATAGYRPVVGQTAIDGLLSAVIAPALPPFMTIDEMVGNAISGTASASGRVPPAQLPTALPKGAPRAEAGMLPIQPSTVLPETATLPPAAQPSTALPEGAPEAATVPPAAQPSTALPDSTPEAATLPPAAQPSTALPDSTPEAATQPSTTLPDSTPEAATVPPAAQPSTALPGSTPEAATVPPIQPPPALPEAANPVGLSVSVPTPPPMPIAPTVLNAKTPAPLTKATPQNAPRSSRQETAGNRLTGGAVLADGGRYAPTETPAVGRKPNPPAALPKALSVPEHNNATATVKPVPSEPLKVAALAADTNHEALPDNGTAGQDGASGFYNDTVGEALTQAPNTRPAQPHTALPIGSENLALDYPLDGRTVVATVQAAQVSKKLRLLAKKTQQASKKPSANRLIDGLGRVSLTAVDEVALNLDGQVGIGGRVSPLASAAHSAPIRLLSMPPVPSIDPAPPAPAAAPEPRQSLASNPPPATRTTVVLPDTGAGQDLPNAAIAHIVSGGIRARPAVNAYI